jgi:hypothetical protein
MKLPLSDTWWNELHESLLSLAKVNTQRFVRTLDEMTKELSERYGDGYDFTLNEWVTAHGDLHWNNLMKPFAILDWEGWGMAPKGYDAATLYAYSLLVPDVANRVDANFQEKLQTRDGILSQLIVVNRLFRRIERGDHPDLTEPLHTLVLSLLLRLEKQPLKE